MTKSPVELSFHFDRIPKPFSRGDRALLVLKTQEGKYILGTKNSYPHGIYRLAGGGIDAGERPEYAACRELHEELGLIREPEQWQTAQEIRVHITAPNAQTDFRFFLFLTTINPTERLKASDDLDAIGTFSTEEMNALIDRFYDLGEHKQPGWGEYGQIYGKIHEIALTL